MNWHELFRNHFNEVEPRVAGLDGDYKGSSFEAIYTSSDDFATIFTALKNPGVMADLGAGMGQGCLIYSSLYPDLKSIAVEFSSPRLEAGILMAQSLGITNIEFQNKNLLTDDLPPADTYFLYFPTGIVLDRILSELYKKDFFQLVVIESHGDLFPRLAKEERLECVQEIALKDKRHAGFAKVYKKRLNLHDFSFLRRYLTVRDQNGEEWIGESFGLEWQSRNLFSLLTPPRTIDASQVLSVKFLHDFPPEIQRALEYRSHGTQLMGSFIRKIFISPRFKLEISTGEQVEWSNSIDISMESSACQKLS